MVNNWTTAKDKQKYNKKHSKQKWKTENKTQNKETKQRSRMMSMKVSARAGDNLHGVGTRGRRLRRHDRLGVGHDSQSLQNNDAIHLWRQHSSRKMHAGVDTSRLVSSGLVLDARAAVSVSRELCGDVFGLHNYWFLVGLSSSSRLLSEQQQFDESSRVTSRRKSYSRRYSIHVQISTETCHNYQRFLLAWRQRSRRGYCEGRHDARNQWSFYNRSRLTLVGGGWKNLSR